MNCFEYYNIIFTYTNTLFTNTIYGDLSSANNLKKF